MEREIEETFHMFPFNIRIQGSFIQFMGADPRGRAAH